MKTGMRVNRVEGVVLLSGLIAYVVVLASAA